MESNGIIKMCLLNFLTVFCKVVTQNYGQNVQMNYWGNNELGDELSSAGQQPPWQHWEVIILLLMLSGGWDCGRGSGKKGKHSLT